MPKQSGKDRLLPTEGVAPKTQLEKSKVNKPAPKKVKEQAVTPVDEKPAQTLGEKPHHSTQVKFTKREYVVKVTLHKVPLKFISIEATETEFILNTFGWSKKYYLKFSFEDNIKVDAEKCDASFEHDILTCTFPITAIRNKETGKILQKKQKKKAGEPKPEAVKMDVEETEKKTENEEAPKLKKKASMTEIDSAVRSNIIDELTKKDEEKISAKLEKEASREQYFDGKKQKKEESQEKKKKLREKALNEVKQKQNAEKKAKKEEEEIKNKPMKRKISFNETVEVIRTPPKKFKSNEQHPKVLKKDAQHKGGPKNSPKPKPISQPQKNKAGSTPKRPNKK